MTDIGKLKALESAFSSNPGNINAAHALIEALRAECERLQDLVYVPGLWRCAKCEFRLIQSNLNTQSGTISPRDDAGDKCPNCNGPLWRVSAMDERNEAYRTANETFEKLLLLKSKCERKDAALRKWLAYDNCDEADFTQMGPMLLYAEAIEATRSALASTGEG